MNSELFHHPTVQRLGWTLIHFIWQGMLLGLFAAMILPALRRARSNTRYIALCIVMLCMLVTPIVTFLFLPGGTLNIPNHLLPNEILSRASIAAFARNVANSAVDFGGIGAGVNSYISAFTLCWAIGVTICAIHFAGGYWRARSLMLQETERVEQWLENRMNELREKLSITTPVRLLESALVEVPTVIGWLRPVILIPASTLSGLSTAQLEAILVHELAHIRRHDYLVNLLQRAIEVLLFYHPCVWWVSSLIRDERENCCDDIAVELLNDSVVYVSALTSLEALRIDRTDLVLAADGGRLSERVRRLVGGKETGSRRPVRKFVILFAICGLAFAGYEAARNRFAVPLYESSVKFIVNPDPENEKSGSATAQSITDPYWIETEMERLRSHDVREDTIRRAVKAKREAQVAKEFLKRLRIRHIANTRILEVSFVDEEPEIAAAVANEIPISYARNRENHHGSKSELRLHTVKQLLDQQSYELRELTDRLWKDEEKLSKAPDLDRKFAVEQDRQELELARKLYEDLKRRSNEIRSGWRDQITPVEVIEPARPSAKPIFHW